MTCSFLSHACISGLFGGRHRICIPNILIHILSYYVLHLVVIDFSNHLLYAIFHPYYSFSLSMAPPCVLTYVQLKLQFELHVFIFYENQYAHCFMHTHIYKDVEASSTYTLALVFSLYILAVGDVCYIQHVQSTLGYILQI